MQVEPHESHGLGLDLPYDFVHGAKDDEVVAVHLDLILLDGGSGDVFFHRLDYCS